MPDRIAATTFNEQAVQRFITEMAAPRGERDMKARGRFGKLHEMIRNREDHFFNRPSADPHLPPPHTEATSYQTDSLRRTWVQLKARMVENPFRIRVIAPDESRTSQRLSANNFEAVLQRGLELVQDRGDFSLQGELADGQIYQCYGVLHWTKASDLIPGMPDLDEVEELPDDDSDRKRFKQEPGPSGLFSETPASQLNRDKHSRARAGFPFHVEVIHPGQFAFTEDNSTENGMAYALVLRTIPLVEYSERVTRQDNLFLSLNEENKNIRIYEEKEKPADWEPSVINATNWTHSVTVAQFWTRDEMYEMVSPSSGGGGSYTLVKSFKHPYNMPPFAVAKGLETKNPDPALRFSPALEGMYRIKPFYDYDRTMQRVLVEQIALPFYWVKLTDGSYMADDGGTRITLTQSAASATAFPPGASLEKVDHNIDPAYVQSIERTLQELKDSAPQTGFVEVGASTQPWTIRQAHDQANTEVRLLKANQARPIRTMARNMAHVMSLPAEEGGFGSTIYVYARVKNGQVDKREAIGVDPEDINTLEIEVDIDPNSTSQTVANVEHGRALLADPNVPLTTRKFLEEFMHVADPDRAIIEWKGQMAYEQLAEPGLMQQAIAEMFGDQFVVTSSGQFVGPDGASATPQQVLEANGVQMNQGGAQSAMSPSLRQESEAALDPLTPLNIDSVRSSMGPQQG